MGYFFERISYPKLLKNAQSGHTDEQHDQPCDESTLDLMHTQQKQKYFYQWSPLVEGDEQPYQPR